MAVSKESVKLAFVIHQREGSDELWDEVEVGPMELGEALSLAKEKKGAVYAAVVRPNYGKTIADFEEAESRNRHARWPQPA